MEEQVKKVDHKNQEAAVNKVSKPEIEEETLNFLDSLYHYLLVALVHLIRLLTPMCYIHIVGHNFFLLKIVYVRFSLKQLMQILPPSHIISSFSYFLVSQNTCLFFCFNQSQHTLVGRKEILLVNRLVNRNLLNFVQNQNGLIIWDGGSIIYALK